MNYPKTTGFKQSTFIILHNFCGSGTQEQLSWMVLPHEVSVKMLARVMVIWRLALGWGSASKVASHTCLGRQCKLAGGLNSSAHEPLCETGVSFPDMAAGFSHSEWSKRRQSGNCNIFYEVTLLFSHYPMHCTDQSYSLWWWGAN